MRFRKKPVVIEAIQYLGPFSLDEMLDLWGEEFYQSLSRSAPFAIKTPEGNLYPSIGDWIIQGVKGEFYPCKPDIFAATYEGVNDA